MKFKNRKKKQMQFVEDNIQHFFSLLNKRFYPEYDHLYVREILRLSEGFNRRLTREEKLQFCKKCHCYWNSETREIRLNSTLKCKEYICKNCGAVRRFSYSSSA